MSDIAACLAFWCHRVRLHLLTIYSKSKAAFTELLCSSPLCTGQQGLVPLLSPLPLMPLEKDSLQEEGRRQQAKLLIFRDYAHLFHLFRAHCKAATAAWLGKIFMYLSQNMLLRVKVGVEKVRKVIWHMTGR